MQEFDQGDEVLPPSKARCPGEAKDEGQEQPIENALGYDEPGNGVYNEGCPDHK